MTDRPDDIDIGPDIGSEICSEIGPEIEWTNYQRFSYYVLCEENVRLRTEHIFLKSVIEFLAE